MFSSRRSAAEAPEPIPQADADPLAIPGPADEPRPRKPSFTRLVAALTGANAVVVFAGLVTGPLQARSLGPSGRGDLAAILVPLTMAPTLLDLGLTSYIVRARARGVARGVLLGSLVPISISFSLIGVFAAFPLAAAIAHGRGTVQTCLTIGLLMSPLWVIMLTAQGLPWGEERWGATTFVSIAGPVLSAIAMVGLYVMGSLTVATAFVVFVGTNFLANAPLIYFMMRSGRWHFRREVVREGTRFGIKVWTGGLFTATDARLDQVLMAGLVSSRQLGLYAVAVSVGNFPGAFVGALATAINPRIAQGNRELASRSCRVSLLIVTVATAAMMAIVPVLLPLLFGKAFSDAVLLTWILLLSAISGTISGALLSALSAAGHPGSAARAQLFVLAPTILSLVLLLPSTGALGASIIATLSSFAKCAALLRQAIAVLGGRLTDYLIIRRADLQSIKMAARRRRAA
jgi:O-antigen/teichoic acid export membrane protein